MTHDFKGTHIIADLYNVSSQRIYNYKEILLIVENAVHESGAHLIDTMHFSFDNGGISLIALLKESHVSLHTYPEFNSLFVDVFTCGNIDAQRIVNQITLFFMPNSIDIQTIYRGHK